MVEPIYYGPIIPMLLVNGSKGIGTGFSTDIMSYNPNEIISYLSAKLKNTTYDKELLPYYEGFKGSVSKISDTKYLIKGVYEKLDANTIRIIELPIGTWTDDYKRFLEGLVDNKKGKKKGFVKDFTEICTDKNVDITVTLHNGRLSELEAAESDFGCNGTEKYFKLYTTNTRTNMHLFDENEQLKLYKTAEEIIEAYYDVRYRTYVERKDYLIKKHETELITLSNKAKYITEVLNGSIDLRRKKKDAIRSMLTEKQYAIIDEDEDYKYLVKMPMDSVSEENVEKLMKDFIQNHHFILIEHLWLQYQNLRVQVTMLHSVY